VLCKSTTVSKLERGKPYKLFPFIIFAAKNNKPKKFQTKKIAFFNE